MTILNREIISGDNKSYKRYRELGYIADKEGKFLINIEDLSTGSHYPTLLKCDSGVNPQCLGTFQREWRAVVKQRARIGNKDYCKFCQKTEEFSGRSNPNTKYYFEDNFMHNIDTTSKAYLLGWIASDGSISKTGSITIKIRDYDIDVLLKIRHIICDELPIVEEKTNMVSLTINSTEMAKDCLKHLGLVDFGKKDTEVNFPKLDSVELDWAFLRGYFEGDGSVNSRKTVIHPIPRVSISSNSKNILEHILELVGFGNIYGSTEYKWEVNTGRLALDFLDKLYEDTSIPRLDRKYDIYNKYSTWRPSTGHNKTIEHQFGNIQVVKSRIDAVIPEIKDINASGIDLHIIAKVEDFSSDVSLYTTGLKVRPPEGFYFILVGRSSISKSGYSLANALGIIDQNYIGEIMVALRKHENKELVLPNRLVQLVLMPKLDFDLYQVDSLEETERGEGGFGSTGVARRVDSTK